MTAKIIQLKPKRTARLTSKRASLPRMTHELSAPLQTLQSHLFADLDAHAERFGRGTVEDLFERWKKEA